MNTKDTFFTLVFCTHTFVTFHAYKYLQKIYFCYLIQLASMHVLKIIEIWTEPEMRGHYQFVYISTHFHTKILIHFGHFWCNQR